MSGQVPAGELRVWTNSFEISSRPKTTYYHYHEFNPPLERKSRRAHEVVDKLQLDNPHVFNPRAAYDGKANMFSRGNINNGEYTVRMSANPNSTRGIFVVKITRVAAIRPNDIDKLISAGGAGAAANTMAVNLLQIIVRQAPNMRHGFPVEARSFFTAHGSRELTGGLQAWHGFFQSVRPVLGRLLINVDVANAVVYAPGPLATLAMQFLHTRDVRELQRIRPGTPDWTKLRSFIKGVLITVTTARTSKARPIKDIVEQAGMYEFEKDGMTTTVRDHYRQQHNIMLRHPALFGVRIGRDAVFPAELCQVIPGQLYKKKLSPDATTSFLRFSTQKPHERKQTIHDGVRGPQQVLDYDNSDFMREAGMRVATTDLITIKGRILPTPQIKYHGRPMHIKSMSGAWNVVGQRFREPGVISSWGVAIFDSKAQPEQVQQFVEKLGRNLLLLGVNIEAKPYFNHANSHQVEESLMDIGQQALKLAGLKDRPPSLIIVVLPSSAQDIRRQVKRWGDILRGVPTQCVRQGKWETIHDQYCNNVALKINAKIGGVNSAIVQQILPPGGIVIGTDVGHPGPGVMNRPSITSLAASLNADATRYTTIAHVQSPRLEIIQNLSEMIQHAIRRFYKFQKGRINPSILFMYRDGVSEGEYAQVAHQELAAINNALLTLRAPDGTTLMFDKQTKPKIVFIVVGKRHHIRFFPATEGPTDRSGNCPPGFVVDDQITNATYPDFYLQSHSGIQGTSRPSHYIVIENEPGYTIQTLQELSFRLCHVYQSATRSVSIPAPVYYADRICARGEAHFREDLHYADSDVATTASGTSNTFPLEQWVQGFSPAVLNEQMYYL